ncbi:hypothetical protein GOBAR_AA20067 [Gossypium barbadense]|uniref:Myb-like domain-containing protein n=1 Tax=Gossypium barbadense TaxID=3634 RepID=A0A2P5XB82_GOSBA|nr:hypothetical protein GOBAR_AA20067 [Gossypium barbadense]
MKTESNTGFYYHGDGLGSILNRHGISFQSAGIDSSSEMIPMSGYFASLPTILPGNSSAITSSPALIQPGNSSGSPLLLDSISGQKHEAGFAVEWSIDEQYILEDSLEKYKDEPSIMKYIKIAATLPDKTVRDVALRCRWMQRKRRKPEELNAGKKVNSRKGKLVESSSKVNMPSALPQNMAGYPLMMHHLDQNGRMSSEVISSNVRQTFGNQWYSYTSLKQNSQAFSQITSNLSAFKLRDNIDLFCHTRNNITAILNDMGDMPGLMSRMPPLPESINDDLAISILPGATQDKSSFAVAYSPNRVA